jgi:hypothetical protein
LKTLRRLSSSKRLIQNTTGRRLLARPGKGLLTCLRMVACIFDGAMPLPRRQESGLHQQLYGLYGKPFGVLTLRSLTRRLNPRGKRQAEHRGVNITRKAICLLIALV